jgi:hypothetical protein
LLSASCLGFCAASCLCCAAIAYSRGLRIQRRRLLRHKSGFTRNPCKKDGWKASPDFNVQSI